MDITNIMTVLLVFYHFEAGYQWHSVIIMVHNTTQSFCRKGLCDNSKDAG